MSGPPAAQETAAKAGRTAPRPLPELVLLGSILFAYFLTNAVLTGMTQAQPNSVTRFFLMFLGNGGLFLMTYCWLGTRGMQRIRLQRMPVACVGLIALCLLLPRVTTHEVSFSSYLLIFLIPPSEELYFRGILLDHFIVNTGRAGAVLLTSALFAVLHLPQGTFLPMLVLGLVLAAVTVKTNKVAWAILLHAAWNFVVVWHGNL